MLKIFSHVASAFQVNQCLVWCERTGHGVIFDAPGDSEQIVHKIETLGVSPVALVNTHGHMDHIGENRVIKDRFKIPLLIHAKDRPMLIDPAKNLSLFTGHNIVSPDADAELAEGETFAVGEELVQVFHVPGHSPGSLVFYYPGFVITGDTLFASGIGRTDFPGGSESVLVENIRKKILSLPIDTIVYPGHGPTTTVGEERIHNPFVRI